MSESPSGRGVRPPLPAGKARPKMVSLRFTVEEYAAIDAAAARAGVSTTSAWAHAAIVEAAVRELDGANDIVDELPDGSELRYLGGRRSVRDAKG